MSKTAFLKRRNGKQRERYAQNQYFRGLARNVAARNPYELERHLPDGTIESITFRQLEADLLFELMFCFQRNKNLVAYAGELTVLRQELECGAKFYTRDGTYYRLRRKETIV